MDKPEGYDDAVDDKRSAVKVILLGDSAVGKTKSAPSRLIRASFVFAHG